MTKFLVTMGVLMVCAGCAHTGDREGLEYTRVEYFETVFQPASEACSRAGGFMIFEDPSDMVSRNPRLSYADMRLAIARGCAGT
jgi:hypothetical protein